MAFPGGAGYGAPAERDPAAVRRDLALGYITVEAAREVYGLSPEDIDRIIASARRGDTV
jgi:N-methylhydantoinase B